MGFFKVSLNELEATVFKACAGAKIPPSVCYSIANSATYLSSIGLKVLEDLDAFLVSSSGATVFRLNKQSRDESSLSVGLSGASCLLNAEGLALKICDELDSDQNEVVHIEEGKDFVFLLPFLQQHVRQPSLFQFWEADKKECFLFEILPDSAFPRGKKISQPFSGCSIRREKDPAQGTFARHAGTPLTRLSFEENRKLCFKQGCEVEKEVWEELKKKTKKFMVKNSEASMQSAGEVADFIDPEDVSLEGPSSQN